MADDDFMELGDTGLVPIDNGWFENKNTGEQIDPEGRVFFEGKLVHDPNEDDECGDT